MGLLTAQSALPMTLSLAATPGRIQTPFRHQLSALRGVIASRSADNFGSVSSCLRLCGRPWRWPGSRTALLHAVDAQVVRQRRQVSAPFIAC